jgi:hypothetical protein
MKQGRKFVVGPGQSKPNVGTNFLAQLYARMSAIKQKEVNSASIDPTLRKSLTDNNVPSYLWAEVWCI